VLAATFDEDENVRTRVFSPSGDDLKVPPAAVATDYPVSIFSWSEMEVLGRQPDLQRELVDRLLPDVGLLIERREGLIQDLASNREQIQALVRDLDTAREGEAGLLGRYVQYRDAYKAINTPEVAALFEELDANRVRSELLGDVDAELAQLEAEIEPLVGADIGARIEALVAEAGPGAQEWWETAAKRELDVSGLDGTVRASAQSVMDEVRKRRTALAELQSAATADVERVEHDLRTRAHLDKEQELQVDQRELARQRFEAANAAREAYLELLEALDTALAQRNKLVVDVTSAQDAISACRARGLEPLNERLTELAGERLDIAVERGHLKDRRSSLKAPLGGARMRAPTPMSSIRPSSPS
jgi:hypothetical protein